MKYDDIELRGMARVAILAGKVGDPRCMELVMRLALQQGMDPNEVWRCIKWLAREEEQKEAA